MPPSDSFHGLTLWIFIKWKIEIKYEIKLNVIQMKCEIKKAHKKILPLISPGIVNRTSNLLWQGWWIQRASVHIADGKNFSTWKLKKWKGYCIGTIIN